MKIIKSAIAVVMAIVMLFTSYALCFAHSATESVGVAQSTSFLETDLPVLTTDTFIKIVKTLRKVRDVLTGKILFGGTSDFTVTWDEEMTEILDSIGDSTSFDPELLSKSLIDLNDPAHMAIKIFDYDVAEYRTKMFEMSDKLKAEGNTSASKICHLVGSYFSGIESAYFYLEYEKGYDHRSVALEITYSDGATYTCYPGLFYNEETQEFFRYDQKGMMQIGFDFSASDFVVYAPIYCWMREFGFCVEYDILCYILPVYRYQTRRFKFDYAGKEWMVQIWKGNYLITNGAEAGLYNRKKGSIGSYYNTASDDEMIPMSLTVYHDDQILVSRKEQNHWWINGFQLANGKLYHPEHLKMVFTYTLPNQEMLDALCKAIDNNIHHDVTYTYDGLKLTVTW